MAPDLSRSRAILIGASQYDDSRIPPLLPAVACLQEMRQLLTGDLCQWPEESVSTFLNVGTPSEMAKQVIRLARQAEDTLLLYYVGHGMRTPEGQLALTLGSTDMDPESLPHTGLLFDNLARILRGSSAATKLIILDCCHAGLGNRSIYHFQSGDLLETYPVDGLYFIGASHATQKARTRHTEGLTYFTENLISVVRDGIPRRPAQLRLDQIFVELRSRLLRNNLPEPVESGIGGARHYPFCRNAAPPDEQLDPTEEVRRLRSDLERPEHQEGHEASDESKPFDKVLIDDPRITSQVVAAFASRKVTCISPRTYTDARAMGEAYRDGHVVAVHFDDFMHDNDVQRLFDFALGSAAASGGSIIELGKRFMLLLPGGSIREPMPIEMPPFRPTSYSQRHTIASMYRDVTIVEIDLSEIADADAKRLVDYSAGVIFACRGYLERVRERIFRLS
jgi:FtsZ-interacting cell division protein YlmF